MRRRCRMTDDRRDRCSNTPGAAIQFGRSREIRVFSRRFPRYGGEAVCLVLHFYQSAWIISRFQLNRVSTDRSAGANDDPVRFFDDLLFCGCHVPGENAGRVLECVPFRRTVHHYLGPSCHHHRTLHCNACIIPQFNFSIPLYAFIVPKLPATGCGGYLLRAACSQAIRSSSMRAPCRS